METYAHFTLAKATSSWGFGSHPSLGRYLNWYLGGAVYPDRTRASLQSHLYCAAERAIDKLATISDNKQQGNLEHAVHELGVAAHYVGDALDRSKKLYASKNPNRSCKGFVRDVQLLLAMGWLHLQTAELMADEVPPLPSIFTWITWARTFAYHAGDPYRWDVPMLSRDGQLTGRRFSRRRGDDQLFFAKIARHRRRVMHRVKEILGSGFWGRVTAAAADLKPRSADDFAATLEKDSKRIVFEEMLGISGKKPVLEIKPAKPHLTLQALVPYLEDDFARYVGNLLFLVEHFEHA